MLLYSARLSRRIVTRPRMHRPRAVDPQRLRIEPGHDSLPLLGRRLLGVGRAASAGVQVVANLLPRLADLHAPLGIERVDRQLAIRTPGPMAFEAVLREQRTNVLGEIELSAGIGDWFDAPRRRRSDMAKQPSNRQRSEMNGRT